MKKKNIFLSYRRDDSPGYVSKMEHDLEQAFGHGRVFRDVDDIAGGSKWKDVLEQNLESAGALLLIIGPRWESIWNQREDHSSDYIVYELEKARELGVPIIPISLNGNKISSTTDLKPIDWILENQVYDISDHQGRWSSDLDGLIRILEDNESIGKRINGHNDSPEKTDKKPIWKYLGIAAAALITLLIFLPDEPTTPVPVDDNSDVVPEPKIDNPIIVDTATKPVIREAIVKPEPVKVNPIEVKPEEIKPIKVEPVKQTPEKPVNVPDIAGKWMGKDGTLYIVEQFSDGSFKIESPGYGSGLGEFIPKMPNKFRVTMQGIGYGEYSVSTDGKRSMGWFIDENTQQKEYETMIRVE